MLLHPSVLARPFAFCAMLAVAASAQQQIHTVPIQSPVLGAPWSTTVTVPKFNPSIGHLLYVRVFLSGSVTGSFGVENTGTSPGAVLAYAGAQLTAGVPGVVSLGINPAFVMTNSAALAAHDGTIDYAGPSGQTFAFTGATGDGAPSNMAPVWAPYPLQAFRGPQGMPGTIDFEVQAWEYIGLVFAPIVADAQLAVSASLTVEYNYSTGPESFCASDTFGGWGGCPCFVSGDPGSGCPNSVFAGGATLGASGTASIANDSLLLSAARMTGSSSIFLQGDELTNSVTFFGDGLRCVSGNLIRLGTGVNTGGASSYPALAQLSVSVRAAISAPCTRYYQTYYRNAAAFCTSDTFNVTNGVALHWTP